MVTRYIPHVVPLAVSQPCKCTTQGGDLTLFFFSSFSGCTGGLSQVQFTPKLNPRTSGGKGLHVLEQDTGPFQPFSSERPRQRGQALWGGELAHPVPPEEGDTF